MSSFGTLFWKCAGCDEKAEAPSKNPVCQHCGKLLGSQLNSARFDLIPPADMPRALIGDHFYAHYSSDSQVMGRMAGVIEKRAKQDLNRRNANAERPPVVIRS